MMFTGGHSLHDPIFQTSEVQEQEILTVLDVSRAEPGVECVKQCSGAATNQCNVTSAWPSHHVMPFLISPSLHSSLSRWLGITLSPWFSLLASCSYSRLLMAALAADLLVLHPMILCITLTICDQGRMMMITQAQ